MTFVQGLPMGVTEPYLRSIDRLACRRHSILMARTSPRRLVAIAFLWHVLVPAGLLP